MPDEGTHPEFKLAAAKIPVELDTSAADLQLDALEERLDRIKKTAGSVSVGQSLPGFDEVPEGEFNLKESDLTPVEEERTTPVPGVNIQRVELPPAALNALTDSANIERAADAAEAILSVLERGEG